MLRRIVDHVATLAPCREVGWPVVGRVMVSVPSGEDNPRRPDLAEHVSRADLDADEPAGTIAPGTHLFVPPPPVAEAEHR